MNIIYQIVVFLHLLLMLFVYFGWLFNNILLLKLLLVVQIVCIIFFIIFKGCILTRLERKLESSKKSFTLIDPILKIMRIKVNNNNRKKLSLFLFIFPTLITIYKINYFYRNKKMN